MKQINYSKANSFIISKIGRVAFILTIIVLLFSCVTEDVVEETNYVPVTILTASANAITTTSANVNATYSAPQTRTITWGICAAKTQLPTTSDIDYHASGNLGIHSALFSNLQSSTMYYARAYTINAQGDINYGNQVNFTTLSNVGYPVVTTSDVTSVTATSAICGGNITSNGGYAVTSRGVCWSTNINPTTSNTKTTDGSGNGMFTSTITGLIANQTYYVRAYATNSVGTSYGSQVSFLATSSTTVTDYDGNVYHTITIGTQVWMVENMKTTHFNDGTTIPLVTDTTSWNNLSTPAYCWYNNSSSYKTPYGALYNWYTVNSGKLAPTGWRVPTDADWTVLSAYLGGVSVAGGKLKESGTTHWLSPNTGATNETGFTALPGGYRNLSPTLYTDMGYDATWWSSTEGNSNSAWCRDMSYSDASLISGNYYKNYGFSVRCVKN